MVLFRDDELRMIAAERAAEPRWKRHTRKAAKTVFWLCAFFALSLALLSTLGGKGDALKRGIEEYISQATGYEAEIGTLNYMAFYPVVGMDFDNLRLYQRVTQPNGKDARKHVLVRGDRVAMIGHVTAAIGFWDLFFSRHTVNVLKIKDIDISSDVVDARQVAIDRLTLEGKGPGGTPAILVEGSYGREKLTGMLEMKFRGRAYGMPDNARFEFKVGDLSVAGNAAHRYARGLVLTIAKAGLPDRLVNGSFTIGIDGTEQQVDTELHAQGGTIAAHLTHRAGQPFRGRIDITALEAEGIRPLAVFLTALAQRWPSAPGIEADLSLPNPTILGRGTAKLRLDGSAVAVRAIAGTPPHDAVKDGAMLHIQAAGLDLTLPRDASGTCFAANFATGKTGVAIERAVIGGGASSYTGRGTIGETGRQAVSLTFKPSATPAKDCALP